MTHSTRHREGRVHLRRVGRFAGNPRADIGAVRGCAVRWLFCVERAWTIAPAGAVQALPRAHTRRRSVSRGERMWALWGSRTRGWIAAIDRRAGAFGPWRHGRLRRRSERTDYAALWSALRLRRTVTYLSPSPAISIARIQNMVKPSLAAGKRQ